MNLKVDLDIDNLVHILKKRYKEIACHGCSGKGVVSSYSHDDFLGPEECKICGGSGMLKLYESGTICSFDGKFQGRLVLTI